MKPFLSQKLVRQSPFVEKFISISIGVFFVLLLLLFLPWQQTIKGVGVLTAFNPQERDYKIASTIDGFIENFYVQENQFVSKGDKIFRMRDLDQDYHNRLDFIQTKSEHKHANELEKIKNMEENFQSQEQIFIFNKQIYNKKILQLSNSLEALTQQKSSTKNQVEIELVHLERSKSLFLDGIESKRDLELKENKYLQVSAQYKKISITLKNTKNQLLITQKELQKFKSETDFKLNTIKNTILSSKNVANTLKQNITKDSVNLARYQNRDILAKTDGYIVRIYQNDQNRLIKKGEDILYFSPLVTKRALRLKISDFNMPLIKEKLKTRIMFYGWPALQISGWPKITHGTYGGIIEKIERTSYENGAYYAIVTEDKNASAWPSDEYLKIGSKANVWTTLNVVPIWYEIWRLLSAQPPEMTNSYSKTK